MANPKRRTSKARRDRRRSHDAIRAVNAVPCQNCGEMRRPHRACPSCGTYNQRDVFPQED